MDAKASAAVAFLVLLSVGLYGSLSYTVWSLHGRVESLQQIVQDANLQSDEPGAVIGMLKRVMRQVDPPSSATEILTNALTEIIEKKLITFMDCNKNNYNETECSLKPGPKGEKGATGQSGIQGKDGQKGEQGPVGPKGSIGLVGPTGFTGERGVKGDTGETGFRGDTGPPGPQGTTGARGRQGEPGNNGDKGQQGYPGYKGNMGPTGIRGEPGLQGVRGLKGELGYKGMKGSHGYPGYKGEKGQKGIPGSQGSPGPIGPPGLTPTTAPRTISTTGSTTSPTTDSPTTDSPTTSPTTNSPTTDSLTTDTPAQCGGPGWRKVTLINMTDPNQNCPQGLSLTTYSKRTCGRASSAGNRCWSTSLTVNGPQYRRVCGRARAYQRGDNYAFYGYHIQRQGIEGSYVDGLSLTHGVQGSRQHIWTFASGLFEGQRSDSHPNFRCPCDDGNSYGSPPFVGNDYFCESVGTPTTWAGAYQTFRASNPLWDGQGCGTNNTCCQLNNPPWFTKELPSPTTADIELRLCLTNPGRYSDIALELLELYVQ